MDSVVCCKTQETVYPIHYLCVILLGILQNNWIPTSQYQECACICVWYSRTCRGGIKCLGHLWFMTAIAMCYMITPILQRLSKYSVLCVISLFAICIVEYYVYPLRLNIFSWLFLYSIGYLLPKLNLCGRLCVLLLSLGMLAYALVGISWADIRGGSVEGTFLHNCAGILVVCLLSFIGKRMKFSIGCGLLLFLDALSYYVYIVHVPFVRPPFDVLHITEFMPLNIAFAIILIFISAFILEKLTKKLTSYIPSFVQ